MPPQLTETWAAAYLQVLFTIFVFALGIPGLLFQLIVPDDIRHVTHRRMRITAWYTSAGLVGVSGIAFVWILHPHAATQSSTEVGHNLILGWKAYVAASAVTLTPFIATIAGILLFNSYKRDKVISRLERSLRKGLSETGTWNEEILDDLLFLGAKGKPGREKELTLVAIGRLVNEVQSREFYRGNQLERPIRGLEEVLANDDCTGNDENFRTTARILERAWSNMKRRNLHGYSDADMTMLTLKNLARKSILEKSDTTALVFLENAGNFESTVVFEIGLLAFQMNRSLIAIAALNKLETIAERQRRISFNRSTAELLALLSAFYKSGETSRQRARDFLLSRSALFEPNLPDCIGASAGYFYSQGAFDVCDDLLRLERTYRLAAL